MFTLLAILGWIASIGAIVLVIQLILMIFFGHHGDFTNADIDASGIDSSSDGNTDGSVDGDGGVKIFSILGLSSFLLMFGLAGRYCIIAMQFHWAVSLLVAAVVGFLVMYLIGWIFYKSKSLESDGTAHIKNALNCIGTVYLPFHEDIIGTVHINMNGVMQEYDAMAHNITDVFRVGDSIRVVEVQGNFVKVIKNN